MWIRLLRGWGGWGRLCEIIFYSNNLEIKSMKLFKYFHPNRTEVLRDGTIRFSSPIVLNDPFELKPYITELLPKEFLNINFKSDLDKTITKLYANFPVEIQQILPIETLFILAKNDAPKLRLIFDGYMNKARNIYQNKMEDVFCKMIGILCLTETPDNLLMWSHYADSHQGFVIEFDALHPFFDRRLSKDDDFRHLRKVIYNNERPKIVLSELDSFAPFLTKGLEWSYESEWRVMEHLENASQIIGEGTTAIHLFEFPKSAVRRVILGCKISESKKADISQIIKNSKDYQHVACVQAQIHKSKYALTFS
jgi:Protein of unknown function (DUF2971)